MCNFVRCIYTESYKREKRKVKLKNKNNESNDF